MSLLEDALAYAAAGLPVLPLSGKIPRTEHGKDDATTDPAVITGWWTRWPTANIGVRPTSGLVVLDVDPRNGGDLELHRLQRAHGQLPDTLTCRTGSGGLHLWMAYYGPAVGKLGAGIDVKTERGYLVAPPSIHPETRQPYEWIKRAGTAPAPQWVRQLLNPPPPSARKFTAGSSGRSVDRLVKFVADANAGERNARLYWAACRALENGIDAAALVDAAVELGLPRGAAEKTARSAANRPPRRGGRSA